MYANLKRRSEACRKRLEEFLPLFVRTRSFSFREEEAAGIVQDLLEDLGYDVVFRDEVGNVLGLLAGVEEGPAVLLNSHMDTRRPDDGDMGEEELFSGRIAQGRLTGLGAAACKGGLAAQIFAAHILDRSLLPLRGTIVVAATVAQEEGNGAGVRHLMTETLPKLGIAPHLAILAEPTSLRPRSGHDGWVDVDVRISGPDAGTTRLAAAAVRAALSTAAPPGTPEAAGTVGRLLDHTKEDRAGGRDELLRFRCRVRAGEEATECAGRAKEVAVTAAEGVAGASADVRVRAERRRFYTGRPVEFLCWNNPWSTDPSTPLVRRALDALSAAGWPDAQARTWEPAEFSRGGAGGIFANNHRVPTICFGPGDENRSGEHDEAIEIDEIVDAVFGTAVLIHGAIGAPRSASLEARTEPAERHRISKGGNG